MPFFLIPLFLLAAVLSAAGRSGPARSLPGNGQFEAQGRVYFLPDSSHRLSLADVRQTSGRFRPVRTPIVQLGSSRFPYWLRFVVANPTSHRVSLMLEIDNPFIDSLRFFGTSSGQATSLGWSVLPLHRPFFHRNPLQRMDLEPHETRTVYVRALALGQPLIVPIRLWTLHDFWVHDHREQVFWGWIIGMFGWIVCLSGGLWLILRERVYALYGFYGLTTLLFLTAREGLWLEWLDWTDYGLLSARNLRHACNYVTVVATLLFIRQYVLLPVWNRASVRRVFWFALGAALYDLGLLLTGRWFEDVYLRHLTWAAPMFSFCYLVSVVSAYGLVLWTAFDPGQRPRPPFWSDPARTYLLSVAPLFLHSVLGILRNYALVPDHLLLRSEGTALSLVTELVILSIGLGFRYKRLADDRQRLTEETYRQQQRAAQAQLQLQQQALEALEAQLRLKQEKERIARDLHDHVGSQLSLIATSLDHLVHDSTDPKLEKRVTPVSDYARDAIQSLRDTIWAIHQETVPLSELKIKFQQYLNRLRDVAEGCELTLRVDGPFRTPLSAIQALNLFRILQEATHNALKHARAGRIVVTCQLHPETGQLTLDVVDNGCGFVPDNLPAGRPHYGLLNMEHRARELGGQATIQSIPGQGSQVRVTIPVPETKAAQNTATTV